MCGAFRNGGKFFLTWKTLQDKLLFELPKGYCYFTILTLGMKKLLPVLLLTIALQGCEKSVQNAQQDLVIKAMTDGQWAITSFTQNGTDITANFTGYKFQYHSNKTVDAIKNGTVEKTGTWDGQAASMTTWANFTNAIAPLSLVNGSWHINNNSWTFVEATQTIGTETKTMRLDKL
jgi:hypothetical protein